MGQTNTGAEYDYKTAVRLDVAPSDETTQIVTTAMLCGSLSIIILSAATGLPFAGVLKISGCVAAGSMIGQALRLKYKTDMRRKALVKVRRAQQARL